MKCFSLNQKIRINNFFSEFVWLMVQQLMKIFECDSAKNDFTN